MIVAADVEGTLTTGETWQAIGHYFVVHGRGRAYRAFFVTHLPGALLVKARLLSRPWYRDRWMVGLARLFKGCDELELRRMAEWVVERELWPLRRSSLVAELAEYGQHGADLILCSTMYEPLLEAFAERLGARALGTRLEMTGGVATGRIAGPVNAGQAKADRLGAAVVHERIAVAYGDTVSDLPMLELSTTPVAVHPDAELRKIAGSRGWRIVVVAD